MLCFEFFPIDDSELELIEESIAIEASTMNGEVHFPQGSNQAIIQIIDDGECIRRKKVRCL